MPPNPLRTAISHDLLNLAAQRHRDAAITTLTDPHQRQHPQTPQASPPGLNTHARGVNSKGAPVYFRTGGALTVNAES